MYDSQRARAMKERKKEKFYTYKLVHVDREVVFTDNDRLLIEISNYISIGISKTAGTKRLLPLQPIILPQNLIFTLWISQIDIFFSLNFDWRLVIEFLWNCVGGIMVRKKKNKMLYDLRLVCMTHHKIATKNLLSNTEVVIQKCCRFRKKKWKLTPHIFSHCYNTNFHKTEKSENWIWLTAFQRIKSKEMVNMRKCFWAKICSASIWLHINYVFIYVVETPWIECDSHEPS